MYYYLHPHLAIAEEAKRIIIEQIIFIQNALTSRPDDLEEAVHDSRKSLKQIRATLRIIRFGISTKNYRHENVIFRDLSRLLSPLRDSFVYLETLDKIATTIEDPTLQSSIETLHATLEAEYLQQRDSFFAESGAIEQVLNALKSAPSRIIRLKIKGNGSSILFKGIQRIYQQGRDEMMIAKKTKSIESFHQWRKRVKYLWYHLRIIQPIAPDLLKDQITDLKELSDYLGTAHDIAMLLEHLDKLHPDNPLKPILYERQLQLEEAAIELGQRLYNKKAKSFLFPLRAPMINWFEKE